MQIFSVFTGSTNVHAYIVLPVPRKEKQREGEREGERDFLYYIDTLLKALNTEHNGAQLMCSCYMAKMAAHIHVYTCTCRCTYMVH